MQHHPHPEALPAYEADGFLIARAADFDLCWDRADTLYVFHAPPAEYAIDHWRFDEASGALAAIMADSRILALPVPIGDAIRPGMSQVRHISIARTINRKIVESCTRPLRLSRHDA